MEASNRLLPHWFARIETGQLRLPRFQRGEAWASDAVASLLEAMLRELPAGAALILQVGDKEKFISRTMVGAPTPTERVNEHLLDGQQRLTALWRALNGLYEDRTYLVRFDSNPNGGNPLPCVEGHARWRKERDDRLWPLWIDLPEEIHSRGYIPVKLLRPAATGKEISKWCNDAAPGNPEAIEQLTWEITDLREKVTTYNLPYLSLPVTTPKDVALDVFIRMNTTSVPLTPFDIVVAQVEEATGESLHDLVRKVKQAAPRVERYTAPEELVLSVAALGEDKPATQSSYQRLDLCKLVNDWAHITDGIRWTVDILEEERIFDSARLPTVAVLPVLGALNAYMPKALDARGNARNLIRSYLWRAFTTRRYENTASSRAFQDFRALRDVLEGKALATSAPIFNELEWPLPSVEELMRAGWPKNKDILARAILAASIRAGALDLADGEPATKTHILKREYHHLFPDALLTGEGLLPEGYSYKALNCALITWNTNRNIGAREPIAYLRERAEKAELKDATLRSRLKSHLIPFDALNVGGYAQINPDSARAEKVRKDFDAFLHVRAARLLPVFVALCNGKEDSMNAWIDEPAIAVA